MCSCRGIRARWTGRRVSSSDTLFLRGLCFVCLQVAAILIWFSTRPGNSYRAPAHSPRKTDPATVKQGERIRPGGGSGCEGRELEGRYQCARDPTSSRNGISMSHSTFPGPCRRALSSTCSCRVLPCPLDAVCLHAGFSGNTFGYLWASESFLLK